MEYFMTKREQRLKEARIAVGLSQADVARLLNVSRSAVFKWENEGAPSNFPATEHLLKLAQIYNKDIQWLMFGDSFSEENDVIFQTPKKGSQGMRLIKIPVVSWELAKKGTLAVPPLPKDHKENIWFGSDIELSKSFALKIKNDSMNLPSPTGKSGCIIVNPEIKTIEPDEFGLFLEKNAREPIFRQLVIDGGTFYLKPLNDKYEMIKLTPDIEIIGRVIAQFSSL